MTCFTAKQRVEVFSHTRVAHLFTVLERLVPEPEMLSHYGLMCFNETRTKVSCDWCLIVFPLVFQNIRFPVEMKFAFTAHYDAFA